MQDSPTPLAPSFFMRSNGGSKFDLTHLESRLGLGAPSIGRACHHFQSTTRVNTHKILLNNQPSSEYFQSEDQPIVFSAKKQLMRTKHKSTLEHVPSFLLGTFNHYKQQSTSSLMDEDPMSTIRPSIIVITNARRQS